MNNSQSPRPRLSTLLLAILPALLTSQALAARPAGKPNIIVIITDDHGYADAGFQGSPDIVTPNLDALAHSAVFCTNGYVSSAVCAPSRAGLLTGRYQQRSGFHDNAWSPLVGLSTECTTIADALHAGGYATCAIGKWHMGQLPQYRPLVRGFTEHYGFLGGGRSFLPLKESQGVAFVPKDPDQVDLWRNENRANEDPPYVTDWFADEAIACINRHKDDPFFLYLAFNAPHVPLQATDKYLARFPNLTGARRTYAAMLSAVDDAIGRISTSLKDTGLEKDTLIFFLSDNGGPFSNSSRNTPLRAEKATIYEGGIRVPFLVKWAGTLPAGTKYDQPVISLDIMATALDVAGLKPSASQPLDGVNLIPHLKGQSTQPPHETLYWRFIQERAIRHGNWKLTMPTKEPAGLFDLSTDISESKDLSAEHPEIVADLKKRLAAWEAEMPPTTPVPRPKPAQN